MTRVHQALVAGLVVSGAAGVLMMKTGAHSRPPTAPEPPNPLPTPVVRTTRGGTRWITETDD